MNQKTVLFVDDEDLVLRSLKRGVYREPYRSLFTTNGFEALDILELEEVHVLVTDMKMPDMSGLELLRTVKEKYPHIVRLVLSGYTQITTLLTAINHGEIFKFITKPWKLEDDFKIVINEAIQYYEFLNQNSSASDGTENNAVAAPEPSEPIRNDKESEPTASLCETATRFTEPLRAFHNAMQFLETNDLSKGDPAIQARLSRHLQQCNEALAEMELLVDQLKNRAVDKSL